MLISPDLTDFWAQPDDSPLPDTQTYVADALGDPLGSIPHTVDIGGSRANGTSVLGTSDSDLLIKHSNPSENPYERLDDWRKFRDDVHRALEKRFGVEAIDLTKKCINVDRSLELPQTDILPCFTHTVTLGNRTVEAVEFWTNDLKPQRIISYPSEHARRGEEKDRRTQGATKKLVRVIKGGRALLIASDVIGPTTAPSYMIESSVINMPDKLFSGDTLEDLRAYVAFMMRALEQSPPTVLMAGHGVYPLIGRDPHRQWRRDDAERFTRELSELVA